MVTTLGQKWLESITGLRGKSGLILIFSAIQSFKRSTLLLATYAWPLLLLDLLYNMYLSPEVFYDVQNFLGFATPLDKTVSGSLVKLLVYFILKFLVSFAAILSVRASVERKDLSYYSLYTFKMWGYFIIFALFVLGYYLAPLPWLVAFFYFDGEKARHDVMPSIVNAVKAALYFLPAFILLWALGSGLDMGVGYIFSRMAIFTELPLFVVGGLRYVCTLVVWLIYLCVVNAWYLKIKHGNYDLFFTRVGAK